MVKMVRPRQSIFAILLEGGEPTIILNAEGARTPLGRRLSSKTKSGWRRRCCQRPLADRFSVSHITD